ncbi:MAG: single-stranded DNA-binding protein [Rivularia sp. (in: cyanobacteria)]
MTINTVSLIGYAGKHPELSYFSSGKVLCKFHICIESNNSNGKTVLEQIDLELWNKTAEIAAKYVPQGRLIGISGSLKFSNWKDKLGRYRHQPVILVNQIYLLGSKQDAFTNEPPTNFVLTEDFNDNEYEYDDYDSFYADDNEYDNSMDYNYFDDNSMDYGYLADMDDVYEHLY